MSDQMEKSTAVQELDSSTTHEDLMPTPPEKRTITSVTFFVMCVGMYVQLLSFINGAQLYPGLSPKMIIFACLAGNGLVWLLLTLTGDIGIKHGLPYAIYLRAPFGYKGSQAPGLVRAIPAMFWFGFQTYLGSMAIHEIVKLIFGKSNLWIIVFLFAAAQVVNCAMGVNAMAKFDWVATPILLVVGIYIEYFLIKNYNITWDVINAPGDGSMSVLMGIAIMAGPQTTMAVSVCDLTRFIKRKESGGFFEQNKGAMCAQFFGMVPVITMFVLIGMTSGIATGEYNPITVMTVVFADNPVILVLALSAFVVFAQIATNTAQNLMPPGYVLSNLFPGKLKYSTAVVICGCVGMAMMPWRFEAHVNIILLVVGCLLGPVVGIMIADYHMLRHRQLNIKALYDTSGQYNYVNGFNPAAFIVWIPGALSGFLIPDYAFFVGIIVGGICYYLMMKFWILKKYPQSEITD
ncbi:MULTISPECIES: cytosine permease [Anaerotruncus]|jgi:NCS1 family nucleobase:cation symporter-1|uniref:cytosine permease n=1 Tax=Anaerotruncus TaxID=244127 RepID=UPI0009AD57FF|nr:MULTISPECIES: cytosine permease [Anaerotruncus]RGX55828.1 thiamine permease [Anaerotruncus sp. AF02-27]